MKKFLIMFMVLILLFSACSKPEEPIAEPPESGEPSEEILSEPEKEFSIDDIDTSEYDEVKDYGFMYVLKKTEGTREGLVLDNMFSSLGEVPNEQVWLLLKNGEFLNEEPFYDVRTYGGNIDAPDEHWVTVCRDGAQYSFYINEKTLEIYDEKIIEPSSEKVFDLNLETYYWISRFPSYGVSSADGTVICEKHYARLSIPFPDRILVADKASDMWSDSHCIIFDEKGNIINSSYNHIRFSILEDGYIGVAYCADPETTYEYEFYQCYDVYKNPMPAGYWLIDKNGNSISEKFDYLYIEQKWQLFAENKNDIIHAFTPDGKEITFTVESVLIKD